MRQLERIIYAIALVTAVIGCAYAYWTTTPSFALTSIVLAVQNHDVQTFEKYCDIDSVTGSAFDDLLNGPARSLVAGKMSGPMVFVGVDFLRFFKNDVVDIAHDQVVQFIGDRNVKLDIAHGALAKMTAGKVPDAVVVHRPAAKPKACPANGAVVTSTVDTAAVDSHKYSDPGAVAHVASSSCPEADDELLQSPHFSDNTKRQLLDFGLSKNGFRGMKYFRLEGNVAAFGLEFYSPKLHDTWIAEFRMEDCGGYWRVTGLSNLNQLVDKYIAVNEQHQL
jgi:hypothetical protein